MEESEGKETNTKSIIDAARGLVKEVPIYKDAIQPAAKQVGKSLETVTKCVNLAFKPLEGLIWGFDKIESFISKRVTEKLKNVPKENITTPPLEVAGPTIEALKFSGPNSNLRELYANLLATSMDKETMDQAHPGFVEIIKNLTRDEASLLQAFITQRFYPLIDIKAKSTENIGAKTIISNYSHFHKKVKFHRSDLVPMYIDNLCRLGILKIPETEHITDLNVYDALINDPELDEIKDKIKKRERKVDFQKKVLLLTAFGKQFVQSVVVEKK